MELIDYPDGHDLVGSSDYSSDYSSSSSSSSTSTSTSTSTSQSNSLYERIWTYFGTSNHGDVRVYTCAFTLTSLSQ
jgi:hypothetical protein